MRALLTGLICVTSLNAASRAVLTEGGPLAAVVSVNASTKALSAAVRLPTYANFFAKDAPGNFVYSVDWGSSVQFTATNAATGTMVYSTTIPTAYTPIGMVLSPVAGIAYVVSNSNSSNSYQGSIAIIDTATGAIKSTLMLSPQTSAKSAPRITNDGSTVTLLTSSG